MGAIFQSLGRTVIAGIVVLVVILLIVGAGHRAHGSAFTHAWWAFFMRWLHVLSGVMWIGLLWYFNFVQIPSMPKIPDEQKPAIGKVIAPTALFWFRWAALATVVTGLLLGVDERLPRSRRSSLQNAVHRHRHRHVARRWSWRSTSGSSSGRTRRRRSASCTVAAEEKAGRGAHGHAHLARQHHAVDPDALLHGGAAERRAVDSNERGPRPRSPLLAGRRSFSRPRRRRAGA